MDLIMSLPPTGRASYKGGILTITTLAKRGTKTVEHTCHYRVQNVHPTPSVATVAFSLTKGEIELIPGLNDDGEMIETPLFTPGAEVYHVAKTEFGPTCSCAHATFRGHNSRVPCKHCLACQAVGLLPK